MESGRRLGVLDNIYLSIYWFSLNFHWGALLTVVLPTEVMRFVAEDVKALYLGYITAVGAFIALVANPVFGAISDRSTNRLGRRRPFVFAGTIINSLALLAMAYSGSLLPFALAFFLVQLGNNISQGPYHGLIPDMVPEEQRGLASGYMGLMTMLGTISSLVLAGVIVGGGHRVGFYWLIVAILLAGMVLTMVKVREKPLKEAPPFNLRDFLASFWIDPRRYPDFAWVFITRALMMLAFYTFLNFLEYYLKDVTRVANYIQATTMVGGVVMVGATVSSFLAGWISDRFGRKIIVCLSGLMMGTTALVLLATGSFEVILAFAVLFGLGYGAYISVDWALAIDVLPSWREAGKDLGIWSISITLPQVLAPFIGGNMIYLLGGGVLGYKALYATAFIYALLGSILVYRVRGAR